MSPINPAAAVSGGAAAVEAKKKERIFGIDVSSHQGNIDWKKVKNDPLKPQFAFIRVSIGATTADSKHIEYASQAKAEGFKIGYYHAAFPDNDIDCNDEADNFCNLMQTLPTADFIPVLDFEINRVKLTKTQMDNWAQNFCKRVKQNIGVSDLLIYSYPAFLNENLSANHPLSSSPLWIARYFSSDVLNEHRINASLPNGWSTWKIWQYAENGRVQGISTNTVDLNVMKGEFFYGL